MAVFSFRYVYANLIPKCLRCYNFGKIIFPQVAGQIDIYGFIGDEWGGTSLKQVADLLNTYKDETEIVVNISSGGGYVNEGKAIYSLLKTSDKTITVNIIGQAYSIASVIAMAGDKIYIAEFADMMVHPAWTFAEGNADDLRETADQLDAISTELFSIYLTRSGVKDNEAKLKTYFDNETFIKAQECIDLGLVDGFMSAAQARVRHLHQYKAVAYFDKKPIQEMNTNITKDEAKGLFAELKAEIKSLFKSFLHPVRNASTTTTDGVTFYYDGDLGVNTAVFSDEAMTTPLADGTYSTADNTMVVAGGIVTEFTAAGQNNADLDAANARISELETQLADATAKAADAEKKIGEVQASFDAKITELQNKILGEGGNPDEHRNDNSGKPARITAAGVMAQIQNKLKVK